MTRSREGSRFRFFRFGLRTLLLLTLVCCLAARLDPLDWRSAFPEPRPIKTVPLGETAEVDLIELNHRPFTRAELAQSSGKQTGWDQVIFWSYHPDGMLHVREWNLVRDPSMIPKRVNGLWVCEFEAARYYDLEERQWKMGPFCRVRAPKFRETTAYTPNDPEILDRKYLPKHERILLWKR